MSASTSRSASSNRDHQVLANFLDLADAADLARVRNAGSFSLSIVWGPRPVAMAVDQRRQGDPEPRATRGQAKPCAPAANGNFEESESEPPRGGAPAPGKTAKSQGPKGRRRRQTEAILQRERRSFTPWRDLTRPRQRRQIPSALSQGRRRQEVDLYLGRCPAQDERETGAPANPGSRARAQ